MVFNVSCRSACDPILTPSGKLYLNYFAFYALSRVLFQRRKNPAQSAL